VCVCADSEGIPIPGFAGLNLVNPQITYADGYLMIETDFDYQPQSGQQDDAVIKPPPPMMSTPRRRRIQRVIIPAN